MSITQVDHHPLCVVLIINCHVSVVLLIRNHHQLPNECTKQSKIKKTIVKSSTCHWNVTPGNAITYHPPKKFKKQKKTQKKQKTKKKKTQKLKNARQERERREKARRSARKNRRIYTDSSPSLRSDRTIPPSLHVYRLGFLLYLIKFPFEFLKNILTVTHRPLIIPNLFN